jgi:hypothetical protein
LTTGPYVGQSGINPLVRINQKDVTGVDPARCLTLAEIDPPLEHGMITCYHGAVPRHPMHTPLGDQRGNTESRHTWI